MSRAMFQLPVLNKVAQPVNDAIVPEEDHAIFSISHPQHLRLIASPLATEEDIHGGHHSHPDEHLEKKATTEKAAPAATSQVQEVDSDSHSQGSSTQNNEDKRHPDEPVLKRAHEASTIQLFFDLFFVANLTTFSTIHEVDNWDALKSYLGYFGVIWFTWLQNTLFDVRFSNDSAFERMCKAMQFGIMTGFAVTGPGYVTGIPPDDPRAALAISSFRTLSFILMASRLILTFQYGVAFLWIKSYKKAVVPMLSHLAVLFTSAMLFLGMSFAFNATANEHVLIGWYFIVACEALAILIISGKVKFLSFRRTVLVERLGLLTLIILGEGIIDMCTSINKVGSDNAYSADVIGMIICSVAIIYFMWMLYFDQVQPERMGTLRQQLWAVLHFPFHVCILLVVEGLSRLSVWRKILDLTVPLEASIRAVVPGSAEIDTQLTALNNTLDGLWNTFSISLTSAKQITLPDLAEYWTTIEEANKAGNDTAVKDSVSNIYSAAAIWVCENFKVETPDVSGDDNARFNAVFALFDVVYIYFFAFAGLNLVLLGLLFLLGKRHKLRGELLSVFVRVFFGVGLALLALMAIPEVRSADNKDNLHRYMYSAWMLPTVLIIYLVVIVLDNLLIRYVKSVVMWRMHLHHHHNKGSEEERGESTAAPSETSVAVATPPAKTA